MTNNYTIKQIRTITIDIVKLFVDVLRTRLGDKLTTISDQLRDQLRDRLIAKIVDEPLVLQKSPADEVTADEVTADEVTAAEVTADEVTADEVTADEVTADEVTADEVTADEPLETLIRKWTYAEFPEPETK